MNNAAIKVGDIVRILPAAYTRDGYEGVYEVTETSANGEIAVHIGRGDVWFHPHRVSPVSGGSPKLG